MCSSISPYEGFDFGIQFLKEILQILADLDSPGAVHVQQTTILVLLEFLHKVTNDPQFMKDHSRPEFP